MSTQLKKVQRCFARFTANRYTDSEPVVGIMTITNLYEVRIGIVHFGGFGIMVCGIGIDCTIPFTHIDSGVNLFILIMLCVDKHKYNIT